MTPTATGSRAAKITGSIWAGPCLQTHARPEETGAASPGLIIKQSHWSPPASLSGSLVPGPTCLHPHGMQTRGYGHEPEHFGAPGAETMAPAGGRARGLDKLPPLAYCAAPPNDGASQITTTTHVRIDNDHQLVVELCQPKCSVAPPSETHQKSALSLVGVARRASTFFLIISPPSTCALARAR